MAVTIKDVAALAGVSPSTVSRTCKDNPSISKETKEKVRKAMLTLGYEPNFQASNLASQNSKTIVLFYLRHQIEKLLKIHSSLKLFEESVSFAMEDSILVPSYPARIVRSFLLQFVPW